MMAVGFLLSACSSSESPLDDGNNDNARPDGSTYTVSGTISGLQNPQVIIKLKWRPIDGSLDSSFGTDGRIDNPALTRGYALALQSDGKVVIAGQRVVGQSPWDLGIVRLDVTGEVDTSFGTDGLMSIDFFGGNDQARAVLIQPDDSILAAGVALNGTQSTMAMVRILP